MQPMKDIPMEMDIITTISIIQTVLLLVIVYNQKDASEKHNQTVKLYRETIDYYKDYIRFVLNRERHEKK